MLRRLDFLGGALAAGPLAPGRTITLDTVKQRAFAASFTSISRDAKPLEAPLDLVAMGDGWQFSGRIVDKIDVQSYKLAIFQLHLKCNGALLQQTACHMQLTK